MKQAAINAEDRAHLMIVGGGPISRRRMWWNFVHTDAARIEAAKAAWRDREFDPVPGDNEFIPLPD